ncbi:MAG: endonuclease MutS2 [Thalassobius sp.]|nr:endonuclease MutS2 [Thalassovita sp.]
MLYPRNLEVKIGFDKIRDLLKERCSGSVGMSYVEKMRFSDRYDLICKLGAQTREMSKLLGMGGDFPRGNYIDIHPILKKASIKGTFLFEEELYDLRKGLFTLQRCLIFLDSDEEDSFPELQKIRSQVEFDARIITEIDAVIDEKGHIRNNASPQLAKIRSKKLSEEENARKRLSQVLQELKKQGIAKEAANATIREGRMVVPIAAEYKRKIKGFVHDTSSSGQTVFIEPEAVLEINNNIRELEFAERQEIIKILTAITTKVHPLVEPLSKANLFLGMIDFIKAKAEFSGEIDACIPVCKDEPLMEWYHAYHPLLKYTYQQQGRKVIPQKIKLDSDTRILVISGPNAGGKSVTLKTVALIQYMFQCGLPIPVSEASTMGVFKNICMDIGDEQSLEDDLSTYSSHLTNMKNFLKYSNSRTICLIDEFGSGTEPQLGAAIAEAILEELNKKKTLGIITTHYANLKYYADRTEGVINGAMRYDVDNLKPLYQLDMGQPGSSFALEIATNIGLPNKVIDKARKKVGTKKVNIEKLLNQLEQEKKELEEKRRSVEKLESELKDSKEKYLKLKEYHEQNKRHLMNEAKQEANRLLQDANRRIENTIKAIKENKAEKNITKAVRKDFDTFHTQLKETTEAVPTKPAEQEKPEVKVIGGKIDVGDLVQIQGQEAIGEVLAISGKDATVAIGDLKTKIKLKRLEKISRTQKKKRESGFNSTSAQSSINRVMTQFKARIDLRGKRVEEVMPLLDDFMDNAIMINHKNLTVVHGKGDGILRQFIRDYLRNIKEIKSMEDEHADRGGPGVTLITLK